MNEIWKEIEVPGYYVSNFGNFKMKNGHILKGYLNKRMGYYMICIKPEGRKGKAKCFKIHRLVARAFIPNPNNYPVINHIDGNKQNNVASNLEWCTYKYNAQHAYKTGLARGLQGTNSPCAALTENDVRYIRANYIPRDKKFGTRALGRKFNVSHDVIIHVIDNSTYKNIK